MNRLAQIEREYSFIEKNKLVIILFNYLFSHIFWLLNNKKYSKFIICILNKCDDLIQDLHENKNINEILVSNSISIIIKTKNKIITEQNWKRRSNIAILYTALKNKFNSMPSTSKVIKTFKNYPKYCVIVFSNKKFSRHFSQFL